MSPVLLRRLSFSCAFTSAALSCSSVGKIQTLEPNPLCLNHSFATQYLARDGCPLSSDGGELRRQYWVARSFWLERMN